MKNGIKYTTAMVFSCLNFSYVILAHNNIFKNTESSDANSSTLIYTNGSGNENSENQSTYFARTFRHEGKNSAGQILPYLIPSVVIGSSGFLVWYIKNMATRLPNNEAAIPLNSQDIRDNEEIRIGDARVIELRPSRVHSQFSAILDNALKNLWLMSAQKYGWMGYGGEQGRAVVEYNVGIDAVPLDQKIDNCVFVTFSGMVSRTIETARRVFNGFKSTGRHSYSSRGIVFSSYLCYQPIGEPEANDPDAERKRELRNEGWGQLLGRFQFVINQRTERYLNIEIISFGPLFKVKCIISNGTQQLNIFTATIELENTLN